jgi:hypothetical protein
MSHSRKSINKSKIEGASEDAILGYKAFMVPIECSFQCQWRAVNVAAIIAARASLKNSQNFILLRMGDGTGSWMVGRCTYSV